MTDDILSLEEITPYSISCKFGYHNTVLFSYRTWFGAFC